MVKRRSRRSARRWLDHVCAAAARAARWLCRRLHRAVAVEVLVTDAARRRSLEREVRRALPRIERIAGWRFPAGSVVIVQQILAGQQHLAGCYQLLAGSPRGPQRVRVQLALQVERRRLSTEEMLATLAEVGLGLADQLADAAGVRVPVVLPVEPLEAPVARQERVAALPPDPLAPITRIGARSPGQEVVPVERAA